MTDAQRARARDAVAALSTDLRIGGEHVPGAGSMLSVSDPATGDVIAEVRSASPEQVDHALRAAQSALHAGLLGTAAQRAAAIERLADELERRADDMLAVVVSETGTPISTARTLHVDVPLTTLRWMAEATRIDRTERLGTVAGRFASEVVLIPRPVGVVAAITAYNYPPMFAAAKVGAAFAAGCPVVLLPSPQAPLSTLLFADLVAAAGLPQGAVSVVTGGVDVATHMMGRREVAKVTFTGSIAAGSAVMAAAAAGIRDVVLELGGKSAAILLPDCDVTGIAQIVHHRYLRNAGQGCAAPARILVARSRVDELIDATRQVYADVVVGDPWDDRTLVGPVISAQHRDRVETIIRDARTDGAVTLAQATPSTSSRGWYVTPTFLGGLGPEALINQEEIFGPVGTLLPYDDIDQAVEIANSTRYGLSASVFGDLDEAIAVAGRLDAGHVAVNGGGPLRPDAPIGGVKESGIGREYGEAGIREFLETVTVQWPVPASPS